MAVCVHTYMRTYHELTLTRQHLQGLVGAITKPTGYATMASGVSDYPAANGAVTTQEATAALGTISPAISASGPMSVPNEAGLSQNLGGMLETASPNSRGTPVVGVHARVVMVLSLSHMPTCLFLAAPPVVGVHARVLMVDFLSQMSGCVLFAASLADLGCVQDWTCPPQHLALPT